MKAMEITNDIVLPFILDQVSKPNQSQEVDDALLTFFNDIILEVFEKIRDIYCVLTSLEIIEELVINQGLKIEKIKNTYSQNFVTKLLTAISSPNLHVPQYNFKTRNNVYRIYSSISINKDLIQKLDTTLFISCVLGAIENEGDPRNLLLVFDLIHFVLLNFC